MMNTKKTKKADLESKKTTLFLVGLVIALSFTLFAFEWKSPAQKNLIVRSSEHYSPPEDIVIPITQTEKIESEKPIIKVPVFKVINNGEEIDIDFMWEGEDPEEPVMIDFSNSIKPIEDPGEENLDAILNTAEIMPEFPGGDAALLSYLAQNVKYPIIAQENGIEGKVFISFVVDENGNIFNVKLAREVDSSLALEAIRVVKSMPRWKPGKQGNRAVKVRYAVPINFILQ